LKKKNKKEKNGGQGSEDPELGLGPAVPLVDKTVPLPETERGKKGACYVEGMGRMTLYEQHQWESERVWRQRRKSGATEGVSGEKIQECRKDFHEMQRAQYVNTQRGRNFFIKKKGLTIRGPVD